MFVHIVMFLVRDPSPERLEAVASLLRGLEGKVPTLRSIEVGIDEFKEARSFHVSLVAKYDDRAGHDAYQAHPAHQEVLQILRSEYLERSVAVDYHDAR